MSILLHPALTLHGCLSALGAVLLKSLQAVDRPSEDMGASGLQRDQAQEQAASDRAPTGWAARRDQCGSVSAAGAEGAC